MPRTGGSRPTRPRPGPACRTGERGGSRYPGRVVPALRPRPPAAGAGGGVRHRRRCRSHGRRRGARASCCGCRLLHEAETTVIPRITPAPPSADAPRIFESAVGGCGFGSGRSRSTRASSASAAGPAPVADEAATRCPAGRTADPSRRRAITGSRASSVAGAWPGRGPGDTEIVLPDWLGPVVRPRRRPRQSRPPRELTRQLHPPRPFPRPPS